MRSKSVAEQIGLDPTPEPKPETPEQQQVRVANAKLRVAFATRDQQHAPKATGVHFVTGQGTDRMQAQMIFDDGSIRNPYKRGKASGRQRRKAMKLANRNMRKAGIKSDVRDLFKGRQSGQLRPSPETPTTTEPAKEAGTPVAD